MKKLKLTINGEVKTFDLPENGEYKCEVTESYVPKVGDCVMIELSDHSISYWCKITDTTTSFTDFKLSVNSKSEISKNGCFEISNNRIYTKITPEELKAKYAEAGYDWDYKTDTIKPIKWMPKNGDCVRLECSSMFAYWFKVTEVSNKNAYFKIVVDKSLEVSSGEDFFLINDNHIYTKITPEELKAKYAEAGYDWDYATDTIKSIKWMPKEGDEVWFLNIYMKPVSLIFDKKNDCDIKLLDKDLLFQTEEECQKFADHCWEFINKK